MSNLSVKSGPAGQQVITEEIIQKDQTVLQFFGKLVAEPTRYSLQVGIDRHLEPGETGSHEGQYIWRFLNHHCDPNCRINFEDMTLVALHEIYPGEQLTLNYNATEGELAEPFDCLCGSEKCLGKVTGYFGLTPGQKEQIKNLAAPYFVGGVAIQ